MSTPMLVIAAILLALGIVLFGLTVLQQARHAEQVSQVLDRALQKASAERGTAADAKVRRNWRQRGLHALELLGKRFENGRLGTWLLASEDRLLLDQANRNTPTGRALYIGLRLALAVALPIVFLPWLPSAGARLLLNALAVFAAGLLLPKLVLSTWAARLRKQADEELPLLIDLLRLLQGVGISMDQSLQIIDERFRTVLPVIGREIHDANIVYAHGRSRAQSLHRLAEAFDNQDLQSVVQIIVQVHEHGGAVQEPLRQFAERVREQRKARMKEKTGKLSVKMTLVMMLTLLPALMLVLAGPAVISLIGTMARLRGH